MKFLKTLVILIITVFTFGSAMAQQVDVNARVQVPVHHRHWHHRHYRHRHHDDDHRDDQH